MNWLAPAVLAWVVTLVSIGGIFETDQSQCRSLGRKKKAGLPHSAGLDCSLCRLGRCLPQFDLDICAGKHNENTKQSGGK